VTASLPAGMPSVVEGPPGRPQAADRREPALSFQALLGGLAYALVGLPLGLAYLVLLSAGLMFALLGVTWLGLPLLLAVVRLAWRGAALERTLANRLLEAHIAPLPPLARMPHGNVFVRARQRLRDGATWRAMALLALKLPVCAAVTALTFGGVGAAAALLVLGAEGLAETTSGYVGPFTLGWPLGLVLCLLAVPVIVVTAALLAGLTRALRSMARFLLAPRILPGGPVRETLAESLGDRSLAIAYWLPDRRTFVDETGHAVALPEPGSNRAWTAVDYGGRRVAAIIHDASLEASPELVQAAAAAASLAIDNERLKAALRARVEELRRSRGRVVEASLAARQKFERDLHDGAQQQLVSLALDLKLLRGRLAADPQATEMIDRITDKLADALAELRELARGIHPAILTDRGLEAALTALAGRSAVAVRCEAQVPGRLPAPVEAAAYFVCAEALTNVLKYARATRVTIRARVERVAIEGEAVVVEVEDDGVGGASEQGGSGLLGLHDRVGALDGTLTVVSPPGEGTVVRAWIPCAAREPTGYPDAQSVGDRGPTVA
jgi:signal transduction histidine kinase